MPGILGFVDGTHILIKKPTLHEELYINRKGQHSQCASGNTFQHSILCTAETLFKTSNKQDDYVLVTFIQSYFK